MYCAELHRNYSSSWLCTGYLTRISEIVGWCQGDGGRYRNGVLNEAIFVNRVKEIGRDLTAVGSQHPILTYSEVERFQNLASPSSKEEPGREPTMVSLLSDPRPHTWGGIWWRVKLGRGHSGAGQHKFH